MTFSFERHHGAMLLKYSGISFISGAVNHGFFSGERSIWTAIAGVVLFVLGALMAHRFAQPRKGDALPWQKEAHAASSPGAQTTSAAAQGSLLRTLLLGALLSVGLGFFTGGLQHFPDSPQRSAWVVPLGFFISVFALVYDFDLRWRLNHSVYALVLGGIVSVASYGSWRWFEAHPHFLGDHAHGLEARTPSEGHGHASQGDEQASGLLAMRVDRSLTIRMDDTMRFNPDTIEVRAGETLRLVVRNEGKTPHELVLGKDEEILSHAAAMKKHAALGHQHAHDAHSASVEVAPQQEAELIVRFEKAGRLQMACLIPGHYEAGMRGLVQIKTQL